MARFIVKIGMYAAVLVTTVLLTRFVLETWRHAHPSSLAPGCQFMGELTAQVGMSSCKTWYENEFQVSYETWTNSLVFVPGFAVLFFGRLGNPNLSG